MKGKHTKKKIVQALSEAPLGLTMAEVAKNADISYPTALKYLETIKGEGLADYRLVGKSKLWFSTQRMRMLEEYQFGELLIRKITCGDFEDIKMYIMSKTFGHLKLLDRRYIVIGQSTLANIIIAFHKSLGYEKAAHVLYNLGEELGKRYARYWKSKLQTGSAKELFERVLRFSWSLGWGRYELVKLDVRKKNYIIRVHDSIIAQNLKNVDMPVDHLQAGILAGMLNHVFGKVVKIVETKCIASGDEVCEFVTR